MNALWETEWQVRALVIGGKSPVLKDLLQLRRSNPEEYKRLLISVRLVAQFDRVVNSGRVERGRKHPQIFEMKAPGGLARLFYFYDRPSGVAVCTNYFQKSKNKDVGQNEAFAKADALRTAYLEAVHEGKGGQ